MYDVSKNSVSSGKKFYINWDDKNNRNNNSAPKNRSFSKDNGVYQIQEKYFNEQLANYDNSKEKENDMQLVKHKPQFISAINDNNMELTPYDDFKSQFECPKCGKNYSSLENLDDHIQQIHQELKKAGNKRLSEGFIPNIEKANNENGNKWKQIRGYVFEDTVNEGIPG
jgi:hypothetical protein